MLATILTATAFKAIAVALFVDGMAEMPRSIKKDLEADNANMPKTTWSTVKAGLGTVGMYAAIAATIL